MDMVAEWLFLPAMWCLSSGFFPHCNRWHFAQTIGFVPSTRARGSDSPQAHACPSPIRRAATALRLAAPTGFREVRLFNMLCAPRVDGFKRQNTGRAQAIQLVKIREEGNALALGTLD